MSGLPPSLVFSDRGRTLLALRSTDAMAPLDLAVLPLQVQARLLRRRASELVRAGARHGCRSGHSGMIRIPARLPMLPVARTV